MRATFLFAALVVAAAQAQTDGSGQGWSVVGARTTGLGFRF